MSPEDWWGLADDTHFVELIDGKLLLHPSLRLTHVQIRGLVQTLLTGYVHHRRLGQVLSGPYTMKLATHRIFQPDVIYMTAVTAVNLTEYWLTGPADLVVEIVAPATHGYDRQEKRECYRAGQVREYWIIDPYERRVTIDRPAGRQVQEVSEGRVSAEACPGFWMEARWLWSAAEVDVNECLKAILAG